MKDASTGRPSALRHRSDHVGFHDRGAIDAPFDNVRVIGNRCDIATDDLSIPEIADIPDPIQE